MAGNRKVIVPDGNKTPVLLSYFLSSTVYNICVLGTVLGLDNTGQFFLKNQKINNEFKSVVAVPCNQCAVLEVAIDITGGRSSD